MFLLASVILLSLYSSVTLAEIQPVPEHRASKMAGWKLVSFQDDRLHFDAERAGVALLVIKSENPLHIGQVVGGTAVLRPGWDGTAGYSHYILEVTAPKSGKLLVSLRSVMPPASAIQTTDEDLSRFSAIFKDRKSRPPESAAEFHQWQLQYRERLTEVLMGGKLPHRVPLEAHVVETKKFPKFQLRRVRYQTQSDRSNELLLSIPDSSAAVESSASEVGESDHLSGSSVSSRPLLIALHGHEADWGQADENAFTMGHSDDFMAYFAERGWCVLQPATMNHTLQHPGWTLQGEWTWDSITALDYAMTLPEVDQTRVAVCGLSTGGHLAMNLLALDERVKAGVVGCVLSTWHHYDRRFRIPPHCDCGVFEQMKDVIEQCDWAVRAAPKPVLFQHGRLDAAFCPDANENLLNLQWNTGVMPMAEYDLMFDEVRRIYRLLDAPDHVQTLFHEGTHKVDPESAYEWLSRSIDRIP